MAKLKLVLFEDQNGRTPFLSWADKRLNDWQFAALDAAIEEVLLVQGIELADTPWLKPLGKSLYEFRIRHSAPQISKNLASLDHKSQKHIKILLRIFVAFPDESSILVIHGYDKASDDSKSRQQREISLAHKRLNSWIRSY